MNIVFTWYVLADFYPPLDEKVENTVEELRREFRFFKEPTVKEEVVRVGEIPGSRAAYTL